MLGRTMLHRAPTDRETIVVHDVTVPPVTPAMGESPSGAKVFISYSRKDMAFVDRLDGELRERGVEALVDRQDIYAFEDWWARIQALIAQADTILFVLSPDAVASDICRQEVDFAGTLNKRFAPVVVRAVEPASVPEALQRLNFIFLDREETYPARLDRLVEALATDIAWVRKHSAYGEAARLWAEAGRPTALLLGARQLEDAERWIATRPADAPIPTEDMQALLVASRMAAKRRRRLVVLSLGLGLVVALGLASVALWQRQVAVANEGRANTQTALATEREEEARREKAKADVQRNEADAQRARAQRSLDNAKSAADGLIFDLAQGLRDRGLPIAVVRAVLGRAETLMARLVESAPDDPDLLRSQAAMYVAFADTYAAAGEFGLQTVATERALAIVRSLAARQPSNVRAARDLAVGLEKIGDVQAARGDLVGAMASYNEALAIRRRLAAQNPSDAGVAREVSASLEKRGDAEVERGDLAGASESYDEGLAIRRRLTAQDPSDVRATRELALSLERVGDVKAARDDIAGALAAYDESLSIRRRLSIQDPSNAGWSRDLSVSLNKVGDMQLARRDLAGASAGYEESLAIRRRLAARDPSNIRAVRDVAVSLSKVGDVQDARGDFAGALVSYEESAAMLRRLAARDPSNADAARDLSLGLSKIGDFQVVRGDLAGALVSFRESIAIRRRLAAQDPSNAQSARDLLVSSGKFGTVAYHAVLARDFAMALTASDEALELAPLYVSFQTNRAHALMMLGRIDEARAIYLRYRGQTVEGDETWETAIAGDFAEMRKAGITHPLMDEIEAEFAKAK